jgi:tetratricopeptide (TPR) repeat protein
MSALKSHFFLCTLAASLLAGADAKADVKADAKAAAPSGDAKAADGKSRDGKSQLGKSLFGKSLFGKSPLDAASDAKIAAPDGKPLAKSARARAQQIPLVGGPAGPDDFALRYYASLKQTARVNAELARLHTLYPSYEPPADLYETPASSVIDEEPFWALFSVDKIDELKAAIATKERELPGWKPSADLASKMRRKELRLKVATLWKGDKIQDLVDYIKGEDVSDLADEPDILWTMAEAYARARQNEDAINMFKRILTTSKDPHIRVATVQKALGALRMSDVETLIAFDPGASKGTNEFAEIAIDLTRARIAAFLHDERAEEVAPAEVQKFEEYARTSRDANQIGLVAWYDYKRRDFTGALDWFKLAIQNDGDAMIAHGLAHSLRALNMKREAEEVAYAWHEPLANNIIMFLDLLETDLTREVPPYIEADRLARYAKVTMEAGSGEGAQALAWYAYNSCQFDVALFWFERAVAWFPKDATVYGYALTLRRLKKDKGLYELANRYDGLFSKVIEILFPDGYYHPPTPCDQKGADKLHGAGVRTTAFMAPGPANIPGAAPNYAPPQPDYAAQKNMSYPVEAQPGQEELRVQKMLKGLKGKFPALVAMENPLRARPMPIASLLSQRAPAAGFATAPESPLRRDPATDPAPLVARRVPGVGPMPYEQYGFSLLAGWNGQETASWPPYTQQIAPSGTQWADQEADPAKAGLALFDQRNAANARGLPPEMQATAPYGQQPSAYPQQPAAAYGMQPPVRSAVAPAPYPSGNYPPAPPPRAPSAYGQFPQPMRR